MNDQQTRNLQTWTNLLNAATAGDHEGMDQFAHPDFTYVNPARPDLRTWAQWKQSPIALYTTFRPNHYWVIKAAAVGDQIWSYAINDMRHTGGIYMGAPPRGNRIVAEWFSILSFKDGKIMQNFSLADLLGMLIQCGSVTADLLPVAPLVDRKRRTAALRRFRYRQPDPVNEGHWEEARSFLHPDFIYRNPARPDFSSADGWLDAERAFRQVCGQPRYLVKDSVSYGPEVWCYWAQDLVHDKGPFLGVNPSGKAIHHEGFSIASFEEGKISSMFTISETFVMFQQMGVVGPGFTTTNPHAPDKGYQFKG
jgi:predicted ester cyclase